MLPRVTDGAQTRQASIKSKQMRRNEEMDTDFKY